MLELIHADHIRDLHESVREVLFPVLLRAVPEEFLHPGVSPEFHAHRVDLRDLTCGVAELRDLLEFCRCETGKRMARLVGQDIHIGVRAVEVGEDERCMVERKCRAVSARALSMFRLQVEEIMFDHEIEKLSALLREFAVHLLSLTDQVFLITDRDRISVRGGQGLIVIIEMLDAECLFLALIELLRSRDNDSGTLPVLSPYSRNGGGADIPSG